MTGRIEPSSLRAYNFSHRWRGEARLGSIRTGSSLRLRFTGQCWPLANAGGDRRWGVRWTWPSSLTWSSKPQSAREAVHTWTSEFVKPVMPFRGPLCVQTSAARKLSALSAERHAMVAVSPLPRP